MNIYPNNHYTAFFARKYGLQPGDCLKESIFRTGLSKHHFIYLGMDHNGVEWVSENQKFAGVRLVEAGKFFKPSKSYTVIRFNGDYQARIQAVQRALQAVGRPYDLILFNCEHYSSFVQSGVPDSKQVKNGALAFLGLIIFAFAVGYE